MNLTERQRAAAGQCTRCGRHEPAPGLLVCLPCVERLVAPKAAPVIPEWRRHLTAKDFTARSAA